MVDPAMIILDTAAGTTGNCYKVQANRKPRPSAVKTLANQNVNLYNKKYSYNSGEDSVVGNPYYWVVFSQEKGIIAGMSGGYASLVYPDMQCGTTN